MRSTTVSVIIPAYNGADHLGAAIQSVLDQTYQGFEVLVVDDASTDNTSQIVHQFGDPRIQYIRHEKNAGANPARNTGIRATTGQVIAFLDQDDLFHPEKLHLHVSHMARHPQAGFTYNARFEFNYGSSTIRELWRPPTTIHLSDLVLGFPIAPSEMVITRNWVLRGHWDETQYYQGGEYTFTGNLFMSGCRFGYVDRALNYRRHHPSRILSDLPKRCEAELSAQRKVLSDPRCPSEVVAMGNVAFANTYLTWAYEAFRQNETELGQGFLRQATSLNPSILEGFPCRLLNFLIKASIADETIDHCEILTHVFAQLPSEYGFLAQHTNWAVARGHLLKGTRHIMWGRLEEASRHFQEAKERGASIDQLYIQWVSYQLSIYANEFGEEESRQVISALTPHFETLGDRSVARRIAGECSASRAFETYQKGDYSNVRSNMIRAVASDPAHLSNRGLWTILLRSFMRRQPQVKG